MTNHAAANGFWAGFAYMYACVPVGLRAMLLHIKIHHGETHKLLVPDAAKRVLEEGISGKFALKSRCCRRAETEQGKQRHG